MKALILGCTGQDGGLLAKSLLSKGCRVVGTSRSSAPNLQVLKSLEIDADLEIKSINICDFRAMLELITEELPDQVYNLAAQSSVSLSFAQPTETFESIVSGTINLLEVSRFLDYRGRLFFAGSSEIFGDTDTPANASSVRSPRSPYAIAKDAAFNAVRLYRTAYGIQGVTGVLFNHESEFRGLQYVTKKIVHGALCCHASPGHRLRLGNLDVSRDWGWAQDYVEAMQILLEAPCLEDHVICTGRTTSLRYFVESVFSQLGMNWQDFVVQDKRLSRPADITVSMGDPGPMAHHTGWRATHDVDAVIEKSIWHAQQMFS